MFKKIIICSLFVFQFAAVNTVFAASEINADKSHALYREAMAHLLGIKGQEKSSELAFKKIEVLAQQGWKTAQHMLGNMYYKGQGTTKNSVRAYLWYSLAAEQDFSIAQEKVVYLRQQLAKTKIQEAEILVSEWKNSL